MRERVWFLALMTVLVASPAPGQGPRIPDPDAPHVPQLAEPQEGGYTLEGVDQFCRQPRLYTRARGGIIGGSGTSRIRPTLCQACRGGDDGGWEY